jgi:hypothetical protein
MSGGVITAAAVQIDSDPGGVLFGVDGGMRYGFVANDTTLPGVAIGLQAPVLPFLLTDVAEWDQLVAADVYVTAARTQSLTSTIGIAASRFYTQPYVQVGSRSPGPRSWYTTQALLVAGEDDIVMWLPSFTWVDAVANRARTTHVTLGAGVGSDSGEMRYLASIALVMEFYGRNAKVR